MKRYFMIALASILLLSIGIVIYGAWLNKEGENNIAERMSSRALALQGERAQMKEIRPVQRWSTVKLSADEMADAVSRVDGVVQSVLVDRQSFVKKGQTIVQVKNEEIPLNIKQADSNIAKAEAEEKRAYNTYQRHLSLMQEDATSLEKVDEAEANYRAASASIEEQKAIRAQLLINQGRQMIEAPISGDVLMLYRREGSYVTAGTAVALIGDFSRLHFKSAMNDAAIRSMMPLDEMKEMVFPQKDFSKVYSTDYGEGNQGADQHFHAHILSVTPSLDIPAEMRYVVWEVDNTSGILEPQTYKDMYIQTDRRTSVLAVPMSALSDQNGDVVYVWNADGLLERREVKTGVDDTEYIEILSGLQPGDIVITSGAEGLEDGMKADVEVKEAEDDGRQ